MDVLTKEKPTDFVLNKVKELLNKKEDTIMQKDSYTKEFNEKFKEGNLGRLYLRDFTDRFKEGDIVRHFKGDLYYVEGLSYDASDDSPLPKIVVSYTALYGDCCSYVRKFNEFMSLAPTSTDDKPIYRYEKYTVRRKSNYEKGD